MQKIGLYFLIVITICFVVYNLSGCDRKDQSILVYSGKGLIKPMEEIKLTFENKYKDIPVNIIYGGSETLLKALKKTQKGDIYIPGSVRHIYDVEDLVQNHQYVALHRPVFCVRKDNPQKIKSLEDLLKPGIKIAIGNKEMCAIGRISEDIFDASPRRNDFVSNVAISATTVNELLDLVVNKEVDAALVWAEMMFWPEAKDLMLIEIPADINKIEEIHIAVLTTTQNKESSHLFSDYVANEGRAIFIKYGFGE